MVVQDSAFNGINLFGGKAPEPVCNEIGTSTRRIQGVAAVRPVRVASTGRSGRSVRDLSKDLINPLRIGWSA